MPRKVLIGNSVLLAVAALCVPIFLSACLYVAYPSVSYAPGVNVGEQPEEVHCFRVDSEEKAAVRHLGISIYRDKSFEIREIPVSAKGNISGQLEISIETGWVGLGNDLTDHSICLLLYRTGYELEQIESWEFRNQVKWKKSANVRDVEDVIDKLINFKRFEPKDTHGHDRCDWSSSIANRYDWTGFEKIFTFAASEYERLAQSDLGKDADADTMRTRLTGKAKKLKELTSP